jgi:hypothetical protein
MAASVRSTGTSVTANPCAFNVRATLSGAVACHQFPDRRLMIRVIATFSVSNLEVYASGMGNCWIPCFGKGYELTRRLR